MNTPIAKLLRRARPLVLAAAALASAGVASATALTLTVATDTPLRMSGAVTGSVYDTPYSAALDHIATTGGGWFNLSSFDLPVVGNNWHAWGTVYEAENTWTQRRVAVKVMRPEVGSGSRLITST